MILWGPKSFGIEVNIRPWCNGSTSGSDPENRGSSPCGRTNLGAPLRAERYDRWTPWVFAFSLLMTGCVKSGPHPDLHQDSTVLVDIANAAVGGMEQDTQRESKALHHYLIGQLSLNDQNFQVALENFSAADKLTTEPSPLIHVKLADLYLRFGELDKALEAAKKALDEKPSDPSTRLLYAGVLEALGRDSDAEPQYKLLLDEFPGKFDAYVLLSNLYVKQGKFQLSLDTLKSLERRDPSDSLAHYYLGRTYELMENFSQAEVEYARVFESDPTLTHGSVELLRVLLRNKKTAKAKALCERMLQQDSNSALARKVLGHLMLGESKLDEALKHLLVLEGIESDASDTRFKIALIQMEKRNFEEATRELSLVLATKPDHSEARYYLASIYGGSGRRAEALKELLTIEKGDPMFVRSRTFAAFLLRQDDDLKQALKVISEAQDVEPENKNLLLYSVLIMRDLRRYDDAEKMIREALSKEPKDERLLFNLGLVLHERGTSAEAIAVMEEVVGLNPRNSDATNYLAYGLAEQNKDLDRAERLARQALEIKPQDPFYLDTLGWIQLKLGKHSEAEENLAKAVSLAGGDLVILDHYVEALMVVGKFQRATSLLKGAVEQPLSAADAADEDTRGAYDRLKEKLRRVRRDHPELSGVEKSVLNKRSEPSSQQTSFETELLTVGKP